MRAGTNGDDAPAEGLAEAGAYSTAGAGFEHGLVVLATGHAYWLVEADGGYRLLVEPHALAVVREQLAFFDRESACWPPRPAAEHPASHRTERLTPAVWAVAVIAVYALQGRLPGVCEEAGALESQALFQRGEWWRVFTALFLHADVAHLAGNVTAGFFVFSAVTSAMGRLRGWLAIAMASAAGNLAVAALNHSEPYRSIGASTAVFAGLGLLTGRAIGVLPKEGGHHRWRAVFVPLAAGVALLGLFGTGGIRTDVMAHVTGFAAGLVFGLAWCARVSTKQAKLSRTHAVAPRPSDDDDRSQMAPGPTPAAVLVVHGEPSADERRSCAD
jgi:membrane associated rhomboid family serine protease